MPVGLTDYVAPLGLFPIAHDDDLLGAYRSVPANPRTGQHFVIKDIAGTASTNTITISAGGGMTVDGAASYIIATNYGSIGLRCVSSTLWATL